VTGDDTRPASVPGVKRGPTILWRIGWVALVVISTAVTYLSLVIMGR
jgi:hypothetical protein